MDGEGTSRQRGLHTFTKNGDERENEENPPASGRFSGT